MQPQSATALALPITLTPGVAVDDPLAAWWLCQVTLRLRREIGWLWYRHGLLGGGEPVPGALPPVGDTSGDVLDLARFDADRARFFETDETARHLSGLIEETPPELPGPPSTGGFGDIVRRLELEPHECLVLALALAWRIDASSGPAFAACMGLPGQAPATLALAQRLWDRPERLFDCLDSSTPLGRAGILAPAPADWESPLTVPPAVAAQLLWPARTASDERSIAADPTAARRIVDHALVLGRLRAACRDERCTVVPVTGPAGAPLKGAAAALAEKLGLPLAAADATTPLHVSVTLAWLRGTACWIDAARLVADGSSADLPDLPVLVFSDATDAVWSGIRHDIAAVPMVELRPMSYGERLAAWQAGLPGAHTDAALADAVADCARRFRGDARMIERACAALNALGEPPRVSHLRAAARADLGLGELAQRVVPRFARDELMLAPKPARQIDAIIGAVRALTRVHYDWGLARAWNEAGLSALFSGPPGTGKTMAAEVIADAVDLPLYRIDLSQVVSKYIGETEKNLRRLFDAADSADVILFFDEADALFGKRSEVKDSHDRYANLEISYLLERIERFKGLAILASNRKKELDEAFLRRLRFIVDFPLPGAAERARIWRLALPDGVDTSDLDIDFLAERLPLAGGHIRSIVFNACLRSVRPGASRAIPMASVVRAARDELEKLGRTISREQFGPHARHLDEPGGEE